MPIVAPALDRRSRVDAARQLGILPRRPLPVLLLLVMLYSDEGTGPPELRFPVGVDRLSATDNLRARLDAADPKDFGQVVAGWARDHGTWWAG